jgi:hypothetical protein
MTEKELLDKLHLMLKNASLPAHNSIGSALLEAGIDKDTWALWKEEYAGEKEVIALIKSIDHTYECKVIEQALSGGSRSTAALLILKNVYGWADKKNQDTKQPEPPKTEQPYIRVSEDYIIEL